MSKQKIAHPKRGTKRTTELPSVQHTSGRKAAEEKPVDAEIHRAAERAGLTPAQRETAERAGIAFLEAEATGRLQIPPPLPKDDALGKARDQIERALAPHLIRASELLSEELAAMMAAGDSENGNVLDALLSIWKIRWEVGVLPKGEANESDDDDSEDERAAEVAS